MGSLARNIALALVGLLVAAPVCANEVGGSAQASGLRIHGAEETLRDFCSTDEQGRMWLTVPGGRQFELVSSITDAVVSNHGDGAFHPFDEAQVRSALDQVR